MLGHLYTQLKSYKKVLREVLKFPFFTRNFALNILSNMFDFRKKHLVHA